MKKWLLILLLMVTYVGAVTLDDKMKILECYMTETSINKPRYKRIKKIVKMLEKLSATDAAIVYHYLELQTKNSWEFV